MAEQLVNRMDVWTRCESDADCMVAWGLCGNPVAINRAHLDEFDSYISPQHPNCAPASDEWIAWRARVYAKCVDGVCTLIDPEKR